MQTVFMIDGRMLATVSFVVLEGDNWLNGQLVKKLPADYGLLPIAVFDGHGKLSPDPQEVELSPGCRLIAVCKLGDLERLVRREPGQRGQGHLFLIR